MRQSAYGRLAGYEDVNDADRLSRDPAMRAVVDRKGLDRVAASTSQMGRFETQWLVSEDNLAALSDLSGAWIERSGDAAVQASPAGASESEMARPCFTEIAVQSIIQRPLGGRVVHLANVG